MLCSCDVFAAQSLFEQEGGRMPFSAFVQACVSWAECMDSEQWIIQHCTPVSPLHAADNAESPCFLCGYGEIGKHASAPCCSKL